jgi:hypothetical protein
MSFPARSPKSVRLERKCEIAIIGELRRIHACFNTPRHSSHLTTLYSITQFSFDLLLLTTNHIPLKLFTMSPLPELPAELLIHIMSSCSHVDIKHLCETCRLLHSKMVCQYAMVWLHSMIPAN